MVLLATASIRTDALEGGDVRAPSVAGAQRPRKPNRALAARLGTSGSSDALAFAKAIKVYDLLISLRRVGATMCSKSAVVAFAN